jgi:serine/threonine protein kinase
MPETRRQPNDEPLSLIEARSVDRLCDRFEAAWRGGDRPPIETFLVDAPHAARAAALRELIALEVEYRRRAGETPRPDEYETRFGESSEMIASVFRRAPGGAENEAPAASSLDTPNSSPTVVYKEKGPWPAPALPGFEILGRLGAGGMGVVYKARQQSLNRVVALKLIRPDVLAGSREQARFRREAEAAARLQHPHVVQVHAIGEHDGQPYAVLEFVEGRTLARQIAAGALPIRDAAALVEKLAHAVQHAHDHGILHRDLKPANVLLAGDRSQESGIRNQVSGVTNERASVRTTDPCLLTPKITDFGLARWLTSSNDQTASGEVLGTPAYMAPEQAAGRLEQLAPATDVYALGAILYESLTGQVAFCGRTPLETLEQVKTQEPTAPRRLRRDVPRDLEAICLKCLEKEPARRYASAAALADDLKRWLAGEPTLARPDGWPRRVRRVLWRERNKVAVVLTVALTGAAVLAAVALSRSPTAGELEAKRQQGALAAMESDLVAGVPVTVVPDKGQPSYFHMRAGAETSQVSLGRDRTFAVHSWGLCLLELVRNPQRTSYRIRAEVRHDNGRLPGEVGVFFGLQEVATARGNFLSYAHLAFNDIDSEVERWRRIPVAEALRGPKPKGNMVHFRPLIFGTRLDGRERNQGLNGSPPICFFQPGGLHADPKKWRQIVVEVTPQTLRGFWDGVPAGATPSASWDSQVKDALADDFRGSGEQPRGFAQRGSIGLYVFKCTACFRRVTVEPLGE